MITFLVIKNNKKESDTITSIKNNYDIDKYNYDIIETSIDDVNKNIINSSNEYVLIIKEPHYFNTVMLEDVFEYLKRYKRDIYMAPFLNEINSIEYRTENFYYGDTIEFTGDECADTLSKFQTHTPSFIISKNFISKNNITYVNDSQFCKDVYSNILDFIYIDNIDFLFFKHNTLKITADDFGMTKGINKAILECFNKKSITHASLMVNQEYTQEAFNMISSNNLKNIGLHFNITQGRSMYDDTVVFSKRSPKELSLEFIENEFDSQLKFMTGKDVIPTYIDMHHNVNFYNEDIENIILKYGIPIRKEENCYTGLYDNVNLDSLNNGFSYPEIMTHPAYLDEDLKTLSKYYLNRKSELDLLLSNRHIIQEVV